MPWLSREALEQVLESLLATELRSIRHRQSPSTPDLYPSPWPASMSLDDAGPESLGCDSIELLWLSAAVNEMFCLYQTHTEGGLLTANTFGDWVDLLDGGWNQAGQHITFTTSGSTGVPRHCTHAMADLQREVAFWSEHLSGTRRVLALAPSHHIYGFLFTAMLPSCGNLPVVQADAFSPSRFARELTAGDLIVSTPLRWDWLARSVPSWPAGVIGLTSTAPCPEPLKSTLAQQGLGRLIEIYGSSETAGIGLRTFPQLRYALFPYWSWADRTPTAPSLADSSGRKFALQDQVEIAPDDTFTITSRLDGAVQVGGVNVFPGRLEELLRSVPGVADAAVRLSTGAGPQRLKAFIVPDGSVGDTTLTVDLERWTASFAAPERIRSFTFGAALPRGPFGKRTDWNELASSTQPA